MFTNLPYRFSTKFVLATVGTVNAPYRVSMALYRWGSDCIRLNKGDTYDAL